MAFDRETLRRKFPNLASELDSKESKISINSIRSHSPGAEKAPSPSFRGYVPDVVDFIRRCDNSDQATEIVNYMEKRGEIDSDYACRLRNQLSTHGVRSFGPKKEDDYYLKMVKSRSNAPEDI